MTDLGADVQLTGPLFTKDAGKVILENMTKMMEEIADSGAEQARRGYEAGSGGRQPISRLGDRVADHIIGRVVARPSHGGRRWLTAAVIQVYNEGFTAAEGRSLMAAGSILEGRTNTMRKVARAVAKKLRQVDLTKGLE